MTVGPISFQLPYALVYRHARSRLPHARAYRLLVGASAVLGLVFWVFAALSGWIWFFVLAAAYLSALALDAPMLRHWVLRRIVARYPGVTTPQQWLFTEEEIVVTNVDGSHIHSPYSVVVAVSEDAQYLYLESAGGGASPIPKSALGSFGQSEIKRLVARAQASAAGASTS